MARRKKIGELRDSETECGYCGAIIPDDAMKCPSCGRYFSAFKKTLAFAVVVIIVVAGMGFVVYRQYTGGQGAYIPGITPIDPNNPTPTPSGKTIVFELKTADAPNTCNNFEKYVRDKFFDGLIFHRVIDGFMIQGGGFYPDMTQKQATYPPINLEISPNLKHIDGAVAMARTNDPNSATSQFYICDGAQPSLDGNYAVFGQVVQGMDIVRAISAVPTGTQGSFSDVPVNNVIIKSATLGTSGGKTYVTLVVDF